MNRIYQFVIAVSSWWQDLDSSHICADVLLILLHLGMSQQQHRIVTQLITCLLLKKFVMPLLVLCLFPCRQFYKRIQHRLGSSCLFFLNVSFHLLNVVVGITNLHRLTHSVICGVKVSRSCFGTWPKGG